MIVLILNNLGEREYIELNEVAEEQVAQLLDGSSNSNPLSVLFRDNWFYITEAEKSQMIAIKKRSEAPHVAVNLDVEQEELPEHLRNFLNVSESQRGRGTEFHWAYVFVHLATAVVGSLGAYAFVGDAAKGASEMPMSTRNKKLNEIFAVLGVPILNALINYYFAAITAVTGLKPYIEDTPEIRAAREALKPVKTFFEKVVKPGLALFFSALSSLAYAVLPKALWAQISAFISYTLLHISAFLLAIFPMISKITKYFSKAPRADLGEDATESEEIKNEAKKLQVLVDQLKEALLENLDQKDIEQIDEELLHRGVDEWNIEDSLKLIIQLCEADKAPNHTPEHDMPNWLRYTTGGIAATGIVGATSGYFKDVADREPVKSIYSPAVNWTWASIVYAPFAALLAHVGMETGPKIYNAIIHPMETSRKLFYIDENGYPTWKTSVAVPVYATVGFLAPWSATVVAYLNTSLPFSATARKIFNYFAIPFTGLFNAFPTPTVLDGILTFAELHFGMMSLEDLNKIKLDTFLKNVEETIKGADGEKFLNLLCELAEVATREDEEAGIQTPRSERINELLETMLGGNFDETEARWLPPGARSPATLEVEMCDVEEGAGALSEATPLRPRAQGTSPCLRLPEAMRGSGFHGYLRYAATTAQSLREARAMEEPSYPSPESRAQAALEQLGLVSGVAAPATLVAEAEYASYNSSSY